MKKLDLYKFRARPRATAANFPSVFTGDYLASDLAVREYGGRVNSQIYVCTETDYYCLIDSDLQFKKIGERLVEKFLEEPNYLSDLIRWSESQINSLRDYLAKKLNPKVVRELSNEELGKRYVQFCENYRRFHLKNTPSWWAGGDTIYAQLEKLLKDLKIDSVEDNLALLSEGLEHRSESQREEFDLLDICIELKKQGQTSETYDSWADATKNLLEKHVAEYSSIPFGYKNGVVWDREHFLGEIAKVLGGPIDPQAQKESKAAKIAEKRDLQENLLKKIGTAEIRSLSRIMGDLAYLQDIKKATQTRSHPLLQTVVKPEIARRLNLNVDDLDIMTPSEVSTALKVGHVTDELRSDLIERSKYFVLIMSDLEFKWLLGDEAKEFVEVNEIIENTESREISGIVASKGNATGKARVCLSSVESSKVEEGDILITAMTTPDYIQAMRKAAAIVTDEGGLTCHAAIISRELNIPCIIGTKIATKVLKDGDFVEVDANSGRVRIVNET